MSLRIAFDLDGVMADLDGALADCAARLFGPDQFESQPGTALRLSKGQSRLVWEAVLDTEDFWTTLGECEPGLVGRIAEMAPSRDWEVLFVTSRPPSAGASIEDQTRRWLARHGFPAPRVIADSRPRGSVVREEGVDVAVDDRLDNCASIVAETTARVFLVRRGDQEPPRDEPLPPGVTRAASVAEILNHLGGTETR